MINFRTKIQFTYYIFYYSKILGGTKPDFGGENCGGKIEEDISAYWCYEGRTYSVERSGKLLIILHI